MKLILIPLCVAFSVAVGCDTADTTMPDFPCTCTNDHVKAIITEEVVATEDIGMRWVVETHHYYPPCTGGDGKTFRIEVMVGYPTQYLREGEPTDTSITNNVCFCGGAWEFTTNGLLKCERVTKRTGMKCFRCEGYVWETNTSIRAVTEEGVTNGK